MQRKRSLLRALVLILVCALLLPAATTAGWQQPTSSTAFQPAGDGSWVLSMPLVFKSSCMPFEYNEGLQQQQWNMLQISAPQAWPCSQGGAGVVIAILDTGVDSDHPDLAGNLVAGASFVDGYTWEDDNGHGTHVAGIAAGIANNGGILGGAPRAHIMPVKVCDAGGSCIWDSVANGIHYAVDNGARVINLSLSGLDYSETLHESVAYAYAHNVVISAAAGNYNTSIPYYPAAYSETIAVAATDRYDNRWPLSNYGSQVDVSAPGVGVYSSYNKGSLYTTMRGTSMAAPHVAGLAALILALRPAWSPAQVQALIERTADDLTAGGDGWDQFTGYGRINAQKAISGIDAVSLESLAVPAPLEAGNAIIRQDPTEFRPGAVLFKLREGAELSAVTGEASIQAAGLQVATVIEELGVRELRVPQGEEQQWLVHLRSLPEVEYAELDGVMHIQ